MDPQGRKEVQTDFLMFKNRNLGANFSQNMHHDQFHLKLLISQRLKTALMRLDLQAPQFHFNAGIPERI